MADDAVVNEGPYQGLKFYEVGEKLYRGGDIARGVPACMACHGPSGSGNPGPAYPRLGGQHAEYVARRLKEYQPAPPRSATRRCSISWRRWRTR